MIEKLFVFLFFCQLGLARSEQVVTTVRDMHDANSLPNDVTGCHQLLLAAYKQSVELEQHAAQAKRHATQAEQRVAQSEQQVAELGRVLDETAASYQQLQQEHAATLDELAWYKRWTFGRKRERFAEGTDAQRWSTAEVFRCRF